MVLTLGALASDILNNGIQGPWGYSPRFETATASSFLGALSDIMSRVGSCPH
jgi:hypothetical protein